MEKWEEEEPVEGERGELRRTLGLPPKWSVAWTKLQEQESLLRTHTDLSENRLKLRVKMHNGTKKTGMILGTEKRKKKRTHIELRR